MKKSLLIGGLLAAGAMSLFAYDVRQIFPENDGRFQFVNLTLDELFDGKGEFSGVVYTHRDGTPFCYPEIDSLVLSNTVRGFRFAREETLDTPWMAGDVRVRWFFDGSVAQPVEHIEFEWLSPEEILAGK
jgi:hypothetical protein